jgi:hypothetical protein
LSSPLAYDDPQAAWSSTELVLAVALLANQTLYIILGDIVKSTTGSHDGDKGNSSESLKDATPSRELWMGQRRWGIQPRRGIRKETGDRGI